jgi:hypothetical protein
MKTSGMGLYRYYNLSRSAKPKPRLAIVCRTSERDLRQVLGDCLGPRALVETNTRQPLAVLFRLQWGRERALAELRAAKPRRVSYAGFNGAASARSRNCPSVSGPQYRYSASMGSRKAGLDEENFETKHGKAARRGCGARRKTPYESGSQCPRGAPPKVWGEGRTGCPPPGPHRRPAVHRKGVRRCRADKSSLRLIALHSTRAGWRRRIPCKFKSGLLTASFSTLETRAKTMPRWTACAPVFGSPRMRSWITGARFRRLMICVIRARDTPPSRANSA